MIRSSTEDERDAVRSYVVESLAEFVDLRPEHVDADADIFTVYRIDSLQLVELATGLERRFSTTVELDEFQMIRTANQIAGRVVQKRGGA